MRRRERASNAACARRSRHRLTDSEADGAVEGKGRHVVLEIVQPHLRSVWPMGRRERLIIEGSMHVCIRVKNSQALSTYSYLPLEHLECSHQPYIQGRGAKKRTQRAG